MLFSTRVFTATASENSIEVEVDDNGSAGVDFYDVYWKIDTVYNYSIGTLNQGWHNWSVTCYDEVINYPRK